MRKDLKAPENYPKKQSLGGMQLSFQSPTFVSPIVDMDISHDEQIMALTQNKRIVVYKDTKVECQELQVGIQASMARFIPQS